MKRKLDVYLHATKAGLLEQGETAELTFSYDRAYLDSESARAISVSMPLNSQPFPNAVAKPYFSGLLPDESARTRLAAALGISDTNAFGMLEIIGGDCAGALALFPHGSDPLMLDSQDEILDQQQLGELLRELRGDPLLGSRKDVRLSLAGAQDKIAVKVSDGRIALVKNGEPTTHILKPGIQGLEGTSQNEVFCMTLAARMGLPVPDVAFGRTDDTQYILIERFDRLRLDDRSVQRLHQEDFCQALSIPPELKYEDEGGPGIEKSLALIQRVVDRPAADRLSFLRMLVFHYLVGNADAHAKNYALLHASNTDAPVLAPLYDVVCTAVYPQLTKKSAMRIGGRNLPDTIQRTHWLSLVPDTRGAQRLLLKELKTLASEIVPTMEQLLSEADDLGIAHPVLQTIGQVIGKRSQFILRSVH
ncbi:type II toxin-antitoxin system HipA family toxin [Granulosicoccus sp. 3-233]|uniref:type II toxin-antitoxin system HipA family toxin n=1 Tax=Granulosicoccus sp. 3-233 TaxID=3417969 RepID=UPI003D3372AB